MLSVKDGGPIHLPVLTRSPFLSGKLMLTGPLHLFSVVLLSLNLRESQGQHPRKRLRVDGGSKNLEYYTTVVL